MQEGCDAAEQDPTATQKPLWLEFMSGDLTVVDVTELLEGVDAADPLGIAQALRFKKPPTDTDSARRVMSVIIAVCEIHMVSPSKIDPFGPRVVLPGGLRTAIPSDFRSLTDPLVELLYKAAHPVLRARLADICWILERRRIEVARVAASAYLATFDLMQRGELKPTYDVGPILSSPEALQCVHRALVIGGAKGLRGADYEQAISLFKTVYVEVHETRNLGAAQRLALIDLELRLTSPPQLAADLETLAGEAPTTEKLYSQLALYRSAVRAYHQANDMESVDRCRLRISERLEIEAGTRSSPMHAASELSDAVSALHGMQGVKERRTALRHKLTDVQANIPDEMHIFSHSEDATDEIKQVRDQCAEKQTLFEKLLVLTSLAQTRCTDDLIKLAKEMLQETSIYSLLGASYYDELGRLVARTDPWNQEDGNDTKIMAQSIAKDESYRRNFAHVLMQWVRLDINSEHYVSEDTLARILYLNPFVPRNKLQSYAHGFAGFFAGDFVSSLSVLTPLLEPLVLHVLKMHNCDVTKFDDATQVEQDKTISNLFEQNRADMDAIFGQALVNDIDGVFLNSWGPKIRHSLAHGLVNDGEHDGPDAIYAIVLMLRLCIFPLWNYRDKVEACLV